MALPMEVAEAVGEAEKAVAHLQDLRLEGMDVVARMLLRGESLASSRIEGLTLSHRRLAQALFDPAQADETARAVLGNIAAMEAAIKYAGSSERIGVEQIKAIHAALLRHTRDEKIAGKFRDKQGWIGGSEDSPAKAEYISPPESEVGRLMEDLCKFMERRDMPALVQAAIAHAQFETIHPFFDGNGRVGRALVHALLQRRGLARTFVPPISMILAANTKAYVGGLNAYRRGEMEEWCAVFAQATRQSAKMGEQLVERFEQLEEKWLEQAGQPRAHSTARAVIHMLPGKPVVDANSVAASLGVSEFTAREALKSLEEAGVLKLTKITSWRRAWAAKEVFDLMNRFEKALAETGGVGWRRRAPEADGEGFDFAGEESREEEAEDVTL
jgi:Fic family protein